MDKDEKKAFQQWLKTATNHEIQLALIKLQALSEQLTEPAAISDWRFLRKGILREMEARRELHAAINNPQK